ncbi:hypothetical protein GCM10027190_59230 [Spirosoma areae]
MLTFVVSTLSASAQKNISQSRFSYQKTTSLFSQIIDSRVEDLFYNGSESVYVMYAKDLVPPTDSTTTTSSGDRITVEWDDSGDGKDFTLYKDYTKGLMTLRTAFSNNKKCIVNDSIPQLHWKLEAQKKRIGPYLCQKATTTFRCAKYTAWFTTAIPLSIGPGKLSGLPGLIVEIVNERANIAYKLLTAEYPTAKKTYLIAPPNTGDPTFSFTEYKKIELMEEDKQRKFISGTAADPRNPEILTQSPECLEGR